MYATLLLLAAPAFAAKAAVQCCRMPFLDIMSPEKLTVCTKNKTDKTLNKWVNSFMLNKLQTGPNNTVLFNKTTNINTLCKVAPFINCVLRTHGITDQNSTVASFNNSVALAHSSLGFQNLLNPVADDLFNLINGSYPLKNLLMPRWNRTISCPAVTKKGKRYKEDIFVGWVVVFQAMQNFVPYNCKTIDATKANKCNETLTNFRYCTDAFFRSEFPANASKEYEIFRDLPREQRGIKTILKMIDNV